MGCEESKGRSEDLHRINWDSKENVSRLLEKIKYIAGIKKKEHDKPRLKIIFIGPTGAGKSSLINCFLSAVKGETVNVAISENVDHVTDMYREYPVYFPNKDNKDEFLDVAFCDTKGMGIDTSGKLGFDILNAVLGQKHLGEEFSSVQTSKVTKATVNEEPVHVIVYVINGNQYKESTRQKESNPLPSLSSILELKCKMDRYDINRYLLVTFMDKVDEKLSNDLNRIIKSKLVYELIGSIQHETKFPDGVVIPVANISNAKPPTNEYRVYYLHLLKLILKDADHIYNMRQYEQKNKAAVDTLYSITCV